MDNIPAFIPDHHQAPDHYLSQRGSEFATPARSSDQIIIPIGCLDQNFMIAVRDLLELTPGIGYNDINLYQIMSEIMNQIGDVVDANLINFTTKLMGNPDDRAVAGYPSAVHLANTELVLPQKWSQFVSIFHYHAREIQAQIMPYFEMYKLNELVYESWLPGAMVFRLAQRQTFYMGL